MKNLDKLIELQTKKLALLNELKESIAYEKCSYHLTEDEGARWQGVKRYFLVSIANGKVVADGYERRIKSYVNLRNIDTNTIYNWQIIEA